MSIEDLPKEIICLIALYIEVPEIDTNLRRVNKYFNSCLELESFYYQMCVVYEIDTKSKPEKIKTLKEWFYRKFMNPKVLFVSSSEYGMNDTIKEKYKKYFPYGNVEKDCQFRGMCSSKKETPTFEEMKKFSVIVAYGGNSMYNNPQWSNDMCKLLEETKAAVVSLSYTNCGDYFQSPMSSYCYVGRWKDELFNPATTNGNRIFGEPHKLEIVNERWKALDKPFSRFFSIEGPLRKDVANLIGRWSNKEIEKTIAICERIDMKLINCNFEMIKESVDIIFECIKYIHKREKVVEKIWYKGKY